MQEFPYFIRSEVFTAMAKKNAVFRIIKILFIPHRIHITPLLESPAG
jgi:hypothetical protein